MNILKGACFLAVLSLLGAGCSEDPAGPSRQFLLSGSAFENVGPSDIVLCIDVSDSISAGELSSIVSDLTNCLGDEALIPQDGTISLAAVVYADSVRSILPAPVPITATSLTQTIGPALSGLLQDRQVPTAGFDLAGALAQADSILSDSQVQDRHVLVLGSGVVNDAGAMLSACQALDAKAVMISTLAVGADAAGLGNLKNCADVTGGFAGELGAEGGSTCSALAYALAVELDLEPETAQVPPGDTHSVTASVFRGGDEAPVPLAGLDVAFSVISGPNVSLGATVATDTAGVASFSYIGAGGAGTDLIVASTLHPGTGATLSDTVSVTWLNTPPVCDAGGPYTLVAEGDTATIGLDATGSSDADGDSLRFAWSVACEGAWFSDAASATPQLTVTGACLCEDSLMVSLTVSDGIDSSLCSVRVDIQDLRPPIVELVETPPQLWPPNHKLRVIRPDMLIEKATDACGNPIDLGGAVILEVSSSEPDNGIGDGNTSGDIEVSCPNGLRLRAERAGGGPGRVYTIVFRITSEDSVSTDVATQVVVPHDASGKRVPGGLAPAFTTSTSCAEGNE